MQLKQVSVNDFLSEVITEAQLQYQLRIVYSSQPMPLIINSDQERLKEAIMNIIKNASEALPDTDRNLTITAVQKANKLQLEIKDHGCGIEEENLDKIFEPFYTTKQKSSGMGLTYTQRIINAHGGSISIESLKENGTSVAIAIPLATQLN